MAYRTLTPVLFISAALVSLCTVAPANFLQQESKYSFHEALRPETTYSLFGTGEGGKGVGGRRGAGW